MGFAMMRRRMRFTFGADEMKVLVFVAAMVAGMLLFEVIERRARISMRAQKNA
jgi:hypothetical protein